MSTALLTVAVLAVAFVNTFTPVAAAPSRSCAVEIKKRSVSDHIYYEISGTGFQSDQELRIEATNRRTDQGYLFFITPTAADFSGIFIGKDPDGFFYRVAPGTWKVVVKAESCTAKTNFSVSGVPNGTWGGDHIWLGTFDSGAQLSFDCASGTVNEPLAPDVDGNFDASGTYTQLSPIAGGPTKTFVARYKGTTDGSSMTITITLTESSTAIGSFNLALGRPARLNLCA